MIEKFKNSNVKTYLHCIPFVRLNFSDNFSKDIQIITPSIKKAYSLSINLL